MDQRIVRLSQTKCQLESEVLEELRLRRAEWDKAPEGERDLARQRFMIALEAFNNLVILGNCYPA